VKNSETVADHAYRVLVLAWIFGRESKLNLKRLLKLALVHSLSAVYINYISPYSKLLDTKSKKELLKKYPALVLRAPIGDKWKIARQRFEEERRAVQKLTQGLPEPIKHEINYLWLDFQQKTSKEAKFLKALDRLENLIQALEYKNQIKKRLLSPFLSQINEVTDNKKILKFAQALGLFFTQGEKAVKNRKDRNLIKFLLEVGKLKITLRKGWVIRGVRNPESIASHSFVAAFMAWVFSMRRRLDQEVVIMMPAIHNIFTAEIGDHTPHDVFLEKLKDVDRVIETFPWIGLKQEKEVIMRETLQKDSRAMDAIFKYLPHQQRHELKYLWLEFRTGTSKEGRFARQVDQIETVLQAMEYHKHDKTVSPTSFWLGLKELVDDQILLQFVESLDNHYYKTRSVA
jgi:putative hydrolase of HD superfamily